MLAKIPTEELSQVFHYVKTQRKNGEGPSKFRGEYNISARHRKKDIQSIFATMKPENVNQKNDIHYEKP